MEDFNCEIRTINDAMRIKLLDNIIEIHGLNSKIKELKKFEKEYWKLKKEIRNDKS